MITTISKTIKLEIDFLKNESKTMITYVLVSQFPNLFILGWYSVRIVAQTMGHSSITNELTQN